MRNRNARYFNALDSAKKVGAVAEVARAFGYLERLDARIVARLDQVRAMPWRLLHC